MLSARSLSFDRLLAAEAFVLVAAIALVVPTQADTFWHLAAGREMFATGHVALTERWSHTAGGGRWANYEWLTQVLFYSLYRLAGLPALTLLSATAIVAACTLVWRQMRGPLEARGLLLILAAANSTIVWAVRPQVLTLFFVGVTLTLVLARRWAWLPPAFLVWANLHGGVALGGLVLAAALVTAFVTERRLVRPILLTGVACVAAGCVTPLGWRYWIELVISIGRSAANRVNEWQPPAPEGPHLIFWSALFLLPVVAVLRRSRLRAFDTAVLVASSLLCGVLASRSQRNVPVFLLLALPAFTRLLWSRPDREDGGDQHTIATHLEPWRARLHAVVLTASILLAVVLVSAAWRTTPSPLGWTPMSPAAAAAIEACPRPVYNPYNEGGYLVWFVPGQPVFLDSRQDPYPVELVQAHIRAEQSQEYQPLFRRYGIRCAVFPAQSQGPQTLSKHGWHEQFRDAQWVVLTP